MKLVTSLAIFRYSRSTFWVKPDYFPLEDHSRPN